jgi:release factor glutamine methyltransferase
MDLTDSHSSFLFQKIKIYTHPEVYEPAEDTFFLIETIEIDPNQDVLEIGAGTGIISLYCAKKGAHVICSDINPYAIHLIKRNINENKKLIQGSIQVRQGNLFEIIKENEQFDLILFNPPYLPTTPEEKQGISSWYAHSFDGGPSGLRITERFISRVESHLKPQGTALFITSSFSNKDKFNKIIKRSTLNHHILSRLRCDDEILTIHQLSRSYLPPSD